MNISKHGTDNLGICLSSGIFPRYSVAQQGIGSLARAEGSIGDDPQNIFIITIVLNLISSVVEFNFNTLLF